MKSVKSTEQGQKKGETRMYENRTVEEVCREFSADLRTGLSAAEVEVRQPLPDAAKTALEQLLQEHYGFRQVRLRFLSAVKEKSSEQVLLGKAIKGKPVSMEGLNPKMGSVVVEGKVFFADCHETRRPGVWVLTFDMTDYKNSVSVR